MANPFWCVLVTSSIHPSLFWRSSHCTQSPSCSSCGASLTASSAPSTAKSSSCYQYRPPGPSLYTTRTGSATSSDRPPSATGCSLALASKQPS